MNKINYVPTSSNRVEEPNSLINIFSENYWDEQAIFDLLTYGYLLTNSEANVIVEGVKKLRRENATEM